MSPLYDRSSPREVNNAKSPFESYIVPLVCCPELGHEDIWLLQLVIENSPGGLVNSASLVNGSDRRGIYYKVTKTTWNLKLYDYRPGQTHPPREVVRDSAKRLQEILGSNVQVYYVLEAACIEDIY